MKLYEISWGIYPRRVGVYLGEKQIPGLVRIDVPVAQNSPSPILGDLTPTGTVPALDTGDGQVIGSSIAILEYLEERYPSPNLLGNTPGARAKTREAVAIIDEATVQMGIWVRNISPVFAGRVPQNAQAGKVAAGIYHRQVRLLEKFAATAGGPFLAGQSVTIADCIGFATLQFAREFYGIPLPDDCPTLQSWYDRFSTRPGVAIPAYPPPLLAMARDLLGHTERL